MSDLVSVIIPVYNVENYILDCIDSILNQSYKNFEIILIDDGSKDQSYEKLFNFILELKTSNRIVLLKQENGGQAKARNLGLDYCRGTYVIFVDSDDFIDEKMLETLVENIKTYNLDICQCTYMNWFGNNDPFNNIYEMNIEDQVVYNGLEYYEKFPSLSPCDKMFKKDFLDKIRFRCIEGYYAEDVFDISKLILNSSRIMFIKECLYFYRRNNMNSTRNDNNMKKKIKLCEDKLYIACRLYDYLKEKNIRSDAANVIIVRNILGPFFNANIKHKEYVKSLIVQVKRTNAFFILLKSTRCKYISEFLKIFYKKKLKKCD